MAGQPLAAPRFLGVGVMPDSQGNTEQIRVMAEQIADTAIVRFVSQHPEVRRGTVVAEIPAPLK